MGGFLLIHGNHGSNIQCVAGTLHFHQGEGVDTSFQYSILQNDIKETFINLLFFFNYKKLQILQNVHINGNNIPIWDTSMQHMRLERVMDSEMAVKRKRGI